MAHRPAQLAVVDTLWHTDRGDTGGRDLFPRRPELEPECLDAFPASAGNGLLAVDEPLHADCQCLIQHRFEAVHLADRWGVRESLALQPGTLPVQNGEEAGPQRLRLPRLE